MFLYVCKSCMLLPGFLKDDQILSGQSCPENYDLMHLNCNLDYIFVKNLIIMSEAQYKEEASCKEVVGSGLRVYTVKD